MKRIFVAGSISLALCSTLAGCCPLPPPLGPEAAPPAASVMPDEQGVARPKLGGVSRADFNRLAAELALPLFWIDDGNGSGAIDPAELAVLWGVAPTKRPVWVGSEGFTSGFLDAFSAIAKLARTGPSYQGLDASEVERRKLVVKELSQGSPTLVRNSFVGASAEDRAIVENIVLAAGIIETIHAKQVGTHALRAQLPEDHAASRMLFYRNHGPWCVAPQTEADDHCNAIPSLPKKVSGLYPPDLQVKPDFCDGLKKHKDGEKLRHQFHVVSGQGDDLNAVPYSEAYRQEMRAVSDKLKAAALAIVGKEEEAFKKYLLAAAKAFEDNAWEPADEAWAAMNVKNSKWYLRIGPDEVYFEPCNLKGGFHVSFARINQDSVAWQNKLDPVKGDMEKALAALAGAPYKARDVSFHLPDFIDIVLNAGDSRSAHGATIGQSLPNWGKVADEGRGRTVAMTNLYTDADSRASLEAQAKSLLCADTMKLFDSATEPQIMGTVLHEAAHNLGPTGSHKVKGKKDREIFGGPLASMLEELKAQTAALYFTDWLVDRKLVGREQADKAHVRDITWAFGHISRGMYESDGKAKPYSQLAAVQVGFLVKSGALEWRAGEKAANGSDVGCMTMHLAKFPPAVEALMREVAGIKGSGDKKRAEQLKAELVDVDGDKKKLLDVIRERWLRAPKASFVYAIEM